MLKNTKNLEAIGIICFFIVGAILIKRCVENYPKDDGRKVQRVHSLQSTHHELLPNPTRDFSSSCKCHKTYVGRKDFYMNQMNSMITWLNLTTLEHLAKHHPNFPASLMPLIFEGKCNLMVAPQRLYWSNLYWQEAMVENTTFLLYSAFIDNRPLTDDRPCVRILAHSTERSPKVPFCYLWFDSIGPPVVTDMKIEYIYWEGNADNLQLPFLMTCRIPPEHAENKPLGVSVVPTPCKNAHNLLEVVGEMERNPLTAYRDGKITTSDNSATYNVAACGSLFSFFMDDLSIRLVEWLELLRALGFSKVFLHTTDVHPNVEKVLQVYEREGFVGYTKYDNPKPYPSEPVFRRTWSRVEKLKAFTLSALYASDCLLRHMHEYRYIAHIDPHEIPMLPEHDSYLSWLDYIIEKGGDKNGSFPSSYIITKRQHANDLPPSENVGDLPDYLWILRHSKVLEGAFEEDFMGVKGLFDTDTATIVMPHNVTLCGSGNCPFRRYEITESDGYIGHYAGECGNRCLITENTTEATYLLRFKDQVKDAVTSVIKELELI